MLTFVDFDAWWTVRGAWLASIVSNTLTKGMRLLAALVATMLRGRAAARAGEVR
jgi:dihydroorotase-like cyclic amidohydrolase